MRTRNGRVSKIVGNGDVNLKTERGYYYEMSGMPRMKINLISIGNLDDEGYSCEFENHV